MGLDDFELRGTQDGHPCPSHFPATQIVYVLNPISGNDRRRLCSHHGADHATKHLTRG